MEEETISSNQSLKKQHPDNNDKIFFDGHDAKSSYLYFLNMIPSDAINEYYILKKLIKHGKTLLRCVKTDSQIDAKRINDLIKEAANVLEQQTIARRQVQYSDLNVGGSRITLYKMTASDANECHAETERLVEMQRDFEKQQYSQHIGKLEAVQEKIHTELINTGIIPAVDDTVDYLIDKMIKVNFQKMLGENNGGV